ncbi:MAG: hypothetical protein UX09_C0009G0004 [Candidatus Uhrbacteria bacterium GW2011_GWE2_45_35]|uniref:HD domain-containing protein n=1 Tax=Candidatus Uhrbacteria bacterium GW2011_GWE2_45_35 TaxID=1618993 RepID=A0A0G1MLB0_9BACT|nr:MAG: hypothetical protein UX09_C0009G0004 [Candidatus Uhrbacteria bacterium GW2011_GWE2_45_35]HBR80969.1 hypothetical protein [Candidatus Uhrbacteria bacterium]HCU31918.1 hypothetical protein [Candidatus Uhrbacteria bacterium]
MDERGHALNTYGTVNKIGKIDRQANRLSQEEFDRLRVAALIHDLGEMEIGDVSYDEKRVDDETAEKKSFEEKLPDYFPDINEEEKKIILKIYHEITQNKDRTEKLAKYFNLVERLGYISNGVEIFQKQPNSVDWQWMVGNILHNQGKHLLNYLTEFESARKFMTPFKETLVAMLEFAKQKKAKDFIPEDAESWQKIIEMI